MSGEPTTYLDHHACYWDSDDSEMEWGDASVLKDSGFHELANMVCSYGHQV